MGQVAAGDEFADGAVECLVYGAGGAVGSLGSGLLWSSAGPQATFVASSLVAALGFTIAWLWVDRERRY